MPCNRHACPIWDTNEWSQVSIKNIHELSGYFGAKVHARSIFAMTYKLLIAISITLYRPYAHFYSNLIVKCAIGKWHITIAIDVYWYRLRSNRNNFKKLIISSPFSLDLVSKYYLWWFSVMWNAVRATSIVMYIARLPEVKFCPMGNAASWTDRSTQKNAARHLAWYKEIIILIPGVIYWGDGASPIGPQ